MADVLLHPSARARLLTRLAEVEALRAMAKTGLWNLLDQPDYASSTALNAKREGVSTREMHRRGVANLMVKTEAEAIALRAKVDLASNICFPDQ